MLCTGRLYSTTTKPPPLDNPSYQLSEEVQKRGEEIKTGVYQTLELETMDPCSMYSKIHRQQTCIGV